MKDDKLEKLVYEIMYCLKQQYDQEKTLEHCIKQNFGYSTITIIKIIEDVFWLQSQQVKPDII